MHDGAPAKRPGLQGLPPPVLTWLRDLLGSAPKYGLLQTFHQPLPEPSMETPPTFLPQFISLPRYFWLRGPTHM